MDIADLRSLRTELEEDLLAIIRARVKIFQIITDVYPDAIEVNMFEVIGLDDTKRHEGIGSVVVMINV